ncbi:EamA family transporter [Alcanivorax sp. S6407]|uniref:DMT family transporter n=1 Tax=Alcanivorax sp. S6407 TaxID=2926424 RepID=UPI001FF68F83|nr:EamA family transporter [Alcanivorax sp. S6407]MCK0153370.1 EamA family transporter [Alcanivorax sp. S6407]
MPTLAAYLIVVAVWATTPLGIKWSGEAMAPLAAAGVRMGIAALLGLMWLRWKRQALPLHRQARISYLAALPGIFGAMGCSYVASSYLPSGLISVIFGLAPLLSGLMMQFLPGSVRLNSWHWGACIMGLFGLMLVFDDSLSVLFAGGDMGDRGIGVLWMLTAVTLFSGSGIAVQRVGAGLKPMQQTVGGLLLSLPFYGLAIALTGQSLTWNGDVRGLSAIVYLAVFGSLLGFYSYFQILARLPAATVALVTLITPVLALTLGSLFNAERLGGMVLAGALLIVVALGLFMLGDHQVRRTLKVIPKGEAA